MYWVPNLKIASNNTVLYRNAMDFLVVEGVISDVDAVRAILTFHEGLTARGVRTLRPKVKISKSSGEVTIQQVLQILERNLPENYLLNVSNASHDFRTGISQWKKDDHSFNNIHYIEGLPLCSNNMVKYRLALFHLYGISTYTQYGMKLSAMEKAIHNHTLNAAI